MHFNSVHPFYHPNDKGDGNTNEEQQTDQVKDKDCNQHVIRMSSFGHSYEFSQSLSTSRVVDN
jgi:hypothetical protein